MSAATEAYLWTLYNRCIVDDGEIVLVDSTARKPIGIYRVDERDRLARDIQKHASCFIKVNLMDSAKIAERQAEKVRTQGYGWTVGNCSEVKSIIGIHLDIDAAKSDKYLTRSQAIDSVNRMPVVPSMIVSTDGSGGGFHVYWCLDQPARIENESDRDQWKAMALRWQERLKAIAIEVGGKSIDSTANIDRVLRPVGSVRASGNRVANHSFSDRYYQPHELYIEPTVDEIQTDAQRSVKALFRSVLGPIDSTGKPVQDYINAAFITPELLLSEAGYTQLRDPLEWRRPNAASSGRSLKIATKLDRTGVNVFSGGDPLFSCIKPDGSVGKFYSVDEMFVILRHGGDWKAAARWCGQQINEAIQRTVSIGGITNA